MSSHSTSTLKSLPLRLYRDGQCQRCRHFEAMPLLGSTPVYCTAPKTNDSGKYRRCLVWNTDRICTDYRSTDNPQQRVVT
ncbi:MAG: hypothetical protein HUU55_22050 [Myxococcales bacterium]|nr:hypothetical protein [Myxococcales bacterium]